MPTRFDDVCQEIDCRGEPATGIWDVIQEAAEAHYDRTDVLNFTTFVAYEYSNSRQTSNLHRNVIFRNSKVPALPATYFEMPQPDDLYRSLEKECLDAGTGCDVLSIPWRPGWPG